MLAHRVHSRRHYNHAQRLRLTLAGHIEHDAIIRRHQRCDAREPATPAAASPTTAGTWPSAPPGAGASGGQCPGLCSRTP
jgi:hypothetical protein